MPEFLTPAQCRAARGLIDWTQEDLAEAAGVSRSTVRDFEKGRHELNRASAAQIRGAFEAAGVVLIQADAFGPGVRLAAPPKA
ncbi:MAG TPA: helix-turn-helix transcriptional regulator [Microvirga sp.]|jgi:transcriptional regulator with XRE-family HTH domain|nr:helix-turn-helix transcriptional regulator [Microvirga sp.]